VLAAASGSIAAGPVRPVADILMAAGAYRVGHSGRTDLFTPLRFRGNYSATSNNMKLVHGPLIDGLLHLVQRGGDWAGPLLAVPNVTAHSSTASVPSPYCCMVVRCSVVLMPPLKG